MKYREENEEVLYPAVQRVGLDRSETDLLVRLAGRNERKRIRLCAHRDPSDDLHEMFIVHAAGTYVRPHLHVGKAESIHVVAGEAEVVYFDEGGRITGGCRVGDWSSGDTFYLRIPPRVYHCLVIRSENLVFHEVTSGPFRREDTLYAPWSPDPDDSSAVLEFTDRMEKEARFPNR